MPTKLFFALDEDKQKRIVSVGISEFAAYGYINSSTNRIVKCSCISKGSLFKYFCSKKELYFFILDTVTAEFTDSLCKQANSLSSDLFQRVIEYSVLEFSWYIRNPEKAKLIITSFVKSDTEIYHEVVERYGTSAVSIYDGLVNDIDSSDFRWDRQKTIKILKWFLKGFNENFLGDIEIALHSFEYIQNEYVKSLTEYMEIIKSGILR